MTYQKTRPTLIFICLSLIITSIVYATTMLPTAHQIDTATVYVGKDSSGCWWLLCDQTYTESYYYATDLNPKELAGHYGSMSPEDEAIIDTITSPDPTMFSIQLRKTNSSVAISFYNDPANAIKEYKLADTSKKYIFSISSSDYPNLKKSL